MKIPLNHTSLFTVNGKNFHNKREQLSKDAETDGNTDETDTRVADRLCRFN